jgi:hypothetical protein
MGRRRKEHEHCNDNDLLHRNSPLPNGIRILQPDLPLGETILGWYDASVVRYMDCNL